MIAEPYINVQTGEIEWMNRIILIDHEGKKCLPLVQEKWLLYVDHERRVLKELRAFIKTCDSSAAYDIKICGIEYNSSVEIGYDYHAYAKESESGRLLARAKFLKAVCEKEGVEWLAEKPCCCEPNSPCKAHGSREQQNIQCSEPSCKCEYYGYECPASLCIALKKQPIDKEEEHMELLWKEKGGKLIPVERDYYTKEGIDEIRQLVSGNFHMMKDIQKEEREWHKDLLDFLDEHFNTMDNNLNRPPLPTLEELRKRFT